jgi:hypothetical protein
MRFPPLFLPFYKMQFMNNLEFSSLIDCFLRISETIRVVWYGFLSGFPPFNAFIIVVSIGKRYIYILIKCNKTTINATFKGKQRDNVEKTKSPPTFSCVCRNLKSK